MLHIVKHPSSLAVALAYAADEDKILLTEDAVYAALPGNRDYPQLAVSLERIYLLKEDLQARGLVKVDECIAQVDFGGFVDLTAEQEKSITW